MHRSGFLALLLGLSTSVCAQVQTVVDFLRQTPAWVSGTVQLEGSLTVNRDLISHTQILPNRQIGFDFGDNFLEVRPAHAMDLRVMGVKIEVDMIRWDATSGFTVRTRTPFGIAQNVSDNTIRQKLNEMFGSKMRAASARLTQLRRARQLSDFSSVSGEIANIFKAGGPAGPPLPPINGTIGLVFNPPQAKVLQLGNTRVAIKANDQIEANVDFRLVGNRITLRGMGVESRLGINVNQGTTHQPNARLVFSHIRLNSQGTNLGVHIGASETLLGFITVFQMAAGAAGHPPSSGCLACLDLVALTPVRLPIERQIRQELLNTLRTQRASLLASGVEASTLAEFVANETCQLNGISCVERCFSGTVSSTQSCKTTCETRLQDCLN
jgi:hypothetical protein